MAITTTVSNHASYMLFTKKIDCENDTFVGVLLNNTFVFNKDTHATRSDISASELTTQYGYAPLTLTGVSVVEDDTEDGAVVTWNDAVWTANGGAIGPSAAMAVFDDTTTDDTVCFCVEFGTTITAADGQNFTVDTLKFKGITA